MGWPYVDMTCHLKDRSVFAEHKAQACFARMSEWVAEIKKAKGQYLGYKPHRTYSTEADRFYYEFVKDWLFMPKFLKGVSFEQFQQEGILADINKVTALECFAAFCIIREPSEHDEKVSALFMQRAHRFPSLPLSHIFVLTYMFPANTPLGGSHCTMACWQGDILEGVTDVGISAFWKRTSHRARKMKSQGNYPRTLHTHMHMAYWGKDPDILDLKSQTYPNKRTWFDKQTGHCQKYITPEILQELYPVRYKELDFTKGQI